MQERRDIGERKVLPKAMQQVQVKKKDPPPGLNMQPTAVVPKPVVTKVWSLVVYEAWAGEMTRRSLLF